MKTIKRSLLAMTLLAASACSHGGGSVVPPVSASGSGATTAASGSRATLSVVVPTATTTSSSQRRVAYVSPSSAKLAVTVNGGTSTAYGLTQQSPGCVMQSGQLLCTFTLAAPTGKDTFGLSVTDAAGNVLSRNTVTATITAGAATPIATTLSGVPATVQVLPLTTAIEGNAPPFQFPGLIGQDVEAAAFDADGNLIIGPGAPTLTKLTVSSGTAYATATPASASDPNEFLLKPIDGTAGGQTVALSATFQGVALSDGTTSAPLTGATTYTFTPAIAVASGIFITMYSAATFNPISQIIACPNCGTTIIRDFTVDAKGGMYLAYNNANASSSIEVLPPGATSAAYTLGTGQGVHLVGGIAVDKNRTLYVANGHGGTVFSGGVKPSSITEYAASSTLPANPTVTISGTTFYPGGIAVDGNLNIYVAEDDYNDVAVYPRNATSATTPITLTDPGFASPVFPAVDASGGVYVSDAQNFGVRYFAPSWSANGGAINATYILTNAGLGSGTGSLMFDPFGNLWFSSATLGASERLSASALPSIATVNGQLPVNGYMGWIP
jgi:hypothetical protein